MFLGYKVPFQQLAQPKARILNNFSTLLSDMYSQIWLNLFLCTNGYATNTYFTKNKIKFIDIFIPQDWVTGSTKYTHIVHAPNHNSLTMSHNI
jgi:hypothetical protein